MAIRIFIAFIVAVFLSIFGHYYIYQRIFYPLIESKESIWFTVYLILCACTFVSFLIIRILPQIIRKFVELIIFTWMGCAFILFVLCIFTIPLQLYFDYAHYSQKLLSQGIFVVGVGVIVYSLFQALRPPAVVSTQVPVSQNLPEGIEDLNVVVLSDIHVSGLIGRRKMTHLANTVNKLNPDFIFITGDLMDGSVKQLRKEIEPLKNLKAKQNIFYITGNHEYYSGPLEWKNHFEKIFNWHVLSNASQTLKINDVTLNILGVEDKHWLFYEKISRKNDERLNKSVAHLFDSREKDENSIPLENCLNILLAHQPKDAKYLQNHPWIHMQVSGHTHGGQIWPIKYLVIKDQKYNKGLYKINNDQFIYVNQGTGFWGPPMRLGTRSEITMMSFKREI